VRVVPLRGVALGRVVAAEGGELAGQLLGAVGGSEQVGDQQVVGQSRGGLSSSVTLVEIDERVDGVQQIGAPHRSMVAPRGCENDGRHVRSSRASGWRYGDGVSDAPAAVTVDRFRMDFGPTTVIRDLSFDVRAGETFGFLGSNGSGKTTTIRALLGIYPPTGGRLLVDGKVFTPESGLRLGYLPEERGLYKKEAVLDVMTYFGALKGMDQRAARTWSAAYLERVGLGGKEKLRLDKLSGGQQQKVQLGVTIMNEPELLILDEPTKGFDPVNRRLLMDIIGEQQAKGATVVMVTHQMEEVERLCDRILLLKDGTARAYGTVTEVQDSFGAPVVRVAHERPLPTSSLWLVQRDEAGVADLEPAPAASTEAILQALVAGDAGVTSFGITRRSLDDIFVEVYGTDAGSEV
jgi:ABC-2 type transport system ATP-binding protein